MCFEFRDTSLVDTFMSDNQLNMKDGACFQCETFWMSSYLPIFENFEKTLYWIMGEWCVSNFETLLYHTQSWVKHDWIWVMDWCVECGCMLVSSSNFSAWENVEENKNEAFLILFLRHSELNQCVGRSHSKQRYRDGIEIKILRGMFGMRVWERMIFFLNFWHTYCRFVLILAALHTILAVVVRVAINLPRDLLPGDAITDAWTWDFKPFSDVLYDWIGKRTGEFFAFVSWNYCIYCKCLSVTTL